jgi:hypothetical protein
MRSWKRVGFAAIALVLSLVLGAAAAEAQVRVTLRLEAPAGHPGFGTYGLTLLKAGVIVGEFNQTAIAAGGSAAFSFTFSVDAVPDEAELDFAVPWDGIRTLYAVAPLDFEFDRAYFLPNPSAGGAIGPQPGDPATDAFFELSVVEFEIPGDQTRPTCEFTEPEPGVIEATLQDSGSGLEEIEVISSRNLSVFVPPFAPGTTDPVTVVASIVDERRTSVLALRAVDGAGNRAYCKKIQRRVRRDPPVEFATPTGRAPSPASDGEAPRRATAL